jgi:hypothetical protein
MVNVNEFCIINGWRFVKENTKFIHFFILNKHVNVNVELKKRSMILYMEEISTYKHEEIIFKRKSKI